MTRFFILFLALFVLAGAAHALETQSQKDNKAYFHCLGDALTKKLDDLGKQQIGNAKAEINALGDRKNPVYAECQSMPGSNDLTFNGIYCANISKLDTAIRLRSDPEVFNFYMFADAKPRSTDHLWYETTNCLMAAPTSALNNINTFAEYCRPQIQKNIQTLKPLAAARGLDNASLGKVLNAEVKTFYKTRLCMNNGGKFD